MTDDEFEKEYADFIDSFRTLFDEDEENYSRNQRAVESNLPNGTDLQKSVAFINSYQSERMDNLVRLALKKFLKIEKEN